MSDEDAPREALEKAVADSMEAEGLLLQLAAAVLPPDKQDLAHTTWREVGDAPATVSEAETRLQQAQKRFRTLVEQIPAVTFMAVLGEGKNEVYVSPHIEQMLGFTQKQWLEDPFLWYSQLHPDDRQLWNEEFARGCRTGGPFRAECRFLARDGSVVWVHGEARLIRDELGRPNVLQGVAFDITDAKKAEDVLVREAVRRAKQEEELLIAQKVQTSILPREFLVEGLEIAAAMLPASEVGGDYYDVLPVDDGAWIAIGDVSGHGLPAGLVMLMLQSCLASVVRAGPDAGPSDVLRTVNEVLVHNIRQRLKQRDHVTLTLLRYRRDGSIVHAGAHEEILIWRKGTGDVELHETPGTWLGARVDAGRHFKDTAAVLRDGDLMVLYTDGITEARNRRLEMYGLDRLCKVVAEAPALPVAEIRDRIFADVRKFTGGQVDDRADDQTVMVLRFTTRR